jgi:plastocyanin
VAAASAPAPAPARPVRGRAGVVFLGLVLAAGCRDTPPEARPPRLELAADTIELPSGTALIEIRLGGPAGASAIEPARVAADVGDVLRFVAADGRGYSVRFDTGRLSAAAAGFLDATGQLASPPLLTPGAAWVVSLADAPPGEYVFHSASHGSTGALIVR